MKTKGIFIREDLTMIIILLALAFLLGRPGEPSDIGDREDISALLKGYTIVVDPGHGGRDSGAIGYSGNTLEKDNTLPIALHLRDMLQAAGARVIMTRWSDYFVSLSERVSLTNTSDADIFVSVHCDWNHDPSRRGTATFYYSKGNTPDLDMLLAQYVQKNMVNVLQSRDVGIFHYNHFVTSRSNIPAVIVEAGYMSNPEDEVLLKGSEYQREVAEGIFMGIVEYFTRASY